MRSWLWGIAATLLRWFLPRILTAASDYIETGLRMVEQKADSDLSNAERRRAVVSYLRSEYPGMPLLIHSGGVELSLLLFKFGITEERANRTERIIIGLINLDLPFAELRERALNELLNQYKDLPETAARLLIEFVLARIGKIWS